MSAADWFEEDWATAPWPVECDCCHRTFGSDRMVVEEGDRWECFDCWEKLNAKEKADEQSRTGDRRTGP